ncbi:MAG: hypothetical protein EHM28_05835 [Spirochaetaceae bacterium]|nr:MAG: hypothetical protein EHM28_05835 [Spirochaetaceae bacterium]
MTAEKNKSAITDIVIYSLEGISLIAFLFTAVMCILVMATYIQLTLQDPLDSPALATLDAKLRDNPEDQNIREQIRALDFLARKAFFTSQEQVKTGGILIFTGVAVMAVSFLTRSLLMQIQPASPKNRARENIFLSNLVSRKSVMVSGGLCAAAGLTLFIISILGGAGNPDIQKQETAIVTDSAVAETPVPDDASADIESVFSTVFGTQYFSSWPGFRGPLGRGIAGADADPPVTWDGVSGKNLAWKQTIPKPGYNSPVVTGNKVFVSGATRKDLGIYCFDALTGKLLWAYEMPAIGATVEVEDQTGFAAPTVAVCAQTAGNNGGVVALFANGDLVAVDLDGKKLWVENLGTPQLNYGFASSPLVWGKTVIVQFDQKSGPRILAKNIFSGQTVWEKPRNVLSSWASPALGLRNGKPALILAANPIVSLHDPATGAELWSTDILTGEIGSSPAYADGLFFEGNDSSTFGAFNEKTGELVWEYWDDLPDVASPLAAVGVVILSSSGGVVTCLDARSGEVLWREDFTDGFYSSPVTAKDRVYLMDKEGICHIISLSRVFSRIASNPAGEPVSTTPAIAGNRIYFRGNKSLFCFSR